MCPSKADVLYIIDTSTNVLAKLTETLAFMTQMARAFPLTAAPTSKGSVMVFNHVAELKIRLKDAATAAPFFAAMAVLGPVTAVGDSSQAMIDLALTMARDEVFLPELGIAYCIHLFIFFISWLTRRGYGYIKVVSLICHERSRLKICKKTCTTIRVYA